MISLAGVGVNLVEVDWVVVRPCQPGLSIKPTTILKRGLSDVAGPHVDMSSVTSSDTNTALLPAKFYRLRCN